MDKTLDSCHSYESSALLQFKTQLITNTTFYENTYYEYVCPNLYPKMRTWDNGTDCCSWMGVTCHSVSGHVIGLDLSCSGLVDMSSISATASPLSLIANMSSSLVTALSLANTGIRGHVTSHILCLPNLQKLYLGGNEDIQIYLPKLNCSTSLLSVLDLSLCQFPGSQIPSSFSNLTHLTSLYLSASELNALKSSTSDSLGPFRQ
ncbi:hypothetical protein S245_022293 [Arachis hypogaea]